MKRRLFFHLLGQLDRILRQGQDPYDHQTGAYTGPMRTLIFYGSAFQRQEAYRVYYKYQSPPRSLPPRQRNPTPLPTPQSSSFFPLLSSWSRSEIMNYLAKSPPSYDTPPQRAQCPPPLLVEIGNRMYPRGSSEAFPRWFDHISLETKFNASLSLSFTTATEVHERLRNVGAHILRCDESSVQFQINLAQAFALQWTDQAIFNALLSKWESPLLPPLSQEAEVLDHIRTLRTPNASQTPHPE